jgi:hypothetical protein
VNGADARAFGGSRDTLSQAGNRAQASDTNSIYFGH